MRLEARLTVRPSLAACAFSQSWRNFARPMSVSGCLKHCSITAAGTVTTSAPMRAASTMWIGLRTLATSTSVPNSKLSKMSTISRTRFMPVVPMSSSRPTNGLT